MELEFRAYKDGRMYNNLAYITIIGHVMSLVPDVPIVRPIIMQSTGLKDKEGTKVFLDDIIETPLGIGVVVWFNDKLGIFSPGSEATDELSAEEISESVVIGNKHQNPELLK